MFGKDSFRGKRTAGWQLLKVSFIAKPDGAKRAYNRLGNVSRKPATNHSLQGIKVMQVSGSVQLLALRLLISRACPRESYARSLHVFVEGKGAIVKNSEAKLILTWGGGKIYFNFKYSPSWQAKKNVVFGNFLWKI